MTILIINNLLFYKLIYKKIITVTNIFFLLKLDVNTFLPLKLYVNREFSCNTSLQMVK